MYPKLDLWIEMGMFVFDFGVIVPLIAVAVGYAAWMGKPENFSREMYFTASVVVGAASMFLLLCTTRMHGGFLTWAHLLQLSCFGLAAVLMGFALGCMVGVVTYQRSLQSAMSREGSLED
jgi:hypothetical protein